MPLLAPRAWIARCAGARADLTGPGLAVSARALAATALVVLLALWLGQRLRDAAVAMAMAKWAAPSPSAIEFAAAIGTRKTPGRRGTSASTARCNVFSTVNSSATLAPANGKWWRYSTGSGRDALYDSLHAALRALRAPGPRLRRPAWWADAGARVLSMALAGTDDLHDRAFSAAAAVPTAMLST